MTRHRYLIAWIVGALIIGGYMVGVALWQMHVGILP
jgi:hypothetical protein